MFNLLSPPIKKETAESWAKILDDIAKVSILALPVVVYSEVGLMHKLFNMLFLISFSYCALIVSKVIRSKNYP